MLPITEGNPKYTSNEGALAAGSGTLGRPPHHRLLCAFLCLQLTRRLCWRSGVDAEASDPYANGAGADDGNNDSGGADAAVAANAPTEEQKRLIEVWFKCVALS